MNEQQHNLLMKLLSLKGFNANYAERLDKYFSNLTIDEKCELFLVKNNLYRPFLQKARDLFPHTKNISHIISLATFYYAVELAKSPSKLIHKKFEFNCIPDFSKAYIDFQKRKKRPQKEIIKQHFFRKTEAMRSEGISWRCISNAISKDPLGIKISHTTLIKIYKEIKKEAS